MASTRTAQVAVQQKQIDLKSKKAKAEIARSNQALQALELAEVVAYYRNRVDAFESDRQSFYEKMNFIRLKQEYVHRIDWELRKREEEKLSLTTALNQCQEALYSEREKVLKMKRDCDTMQLKQNHTKKQMLDRLAQSNSVEQHVYLDHGQAPEKIQSYATKTDQQLAEEEVARGMFKDKRVPIPGTPSSNITNNNGGSQNILRTIHMPNESANVARGQQNKLQSQLAEMRANYEAALQQMRDEKSQFEENMRERYLAGKNKMDHLYAEIHKVEKFNQEIVRDHTDTLTSHELQERRLQEELAALRAQNLSMRTQINTSQQKTEQTKSKAKDQYVRDTIDLQKHLQEQDRAQQQANAAIKDQYRKVSDIHKRKCEDLQQQIDKETSKTQRVENRRKCELEGFSADLQNMQRKVEFYHKYIRKLKSLVQEDKQVDDLYDQINEAASEMEESPIRNEANNAPERQLQAQESQELEGH